MKVLGIAPSSTDFKWAFLDGTRAQPRVLPLSSTSQKLPADACEGHALLSLRRLLSTFLAERGVERICVLQAGRSQHGGPSASRVKAEGIVQLVGAELELAVELVTPQSLRAQEKRFASIASGSPENVLNGSADFKPKTWRDAVLVAWWGLDE
ncbi:hypothetical protein [Micromonospora halophytica]|uniref:Uncharacterized protein n=1 Tax=Micromonospora halophytica TaxID=47864 RepID=A0A1C5IPM0_9ACTN|nr:hypothetical protein [Micromonospora halophytica]SCG59931.1 hypothetical protein GA0070560_11473 [Micromonospora halophytica]